MDINYIGAWEKGNKKAFETMFKGFYLLHYSFSIFVIRPMTCLGEEPRIFSPKVNRATRKQKQTGQNKNDR